MVIENKEQKQEPKVDKEKQNLKFAKVLKWFGGLIVFFAFLFLLIQGVNAIFLIRNPDLALLGFAYLFLYLARLLLSELRWW